MISGGSEKESGFSGAKGSSSTTERTCRHCSQRPIQAGNTPVHTNTSAGGGGFCSCRTRARTAALSFTRCSVTGAKSEVHRYIAMTAQGALVASVRASRIQLPRCSKSAQKADAHGVPPRCLARTARAAHKSAQPAVPRSDQKSLTSAAETTNSPAPAKLRMRHRSHRTTRRSRARVAMKQCHAWPEAARATPATAREIAVVATMAAATVAGEVVVVVVAVQKVEVRAMAESATVMAVEPVEAR
mmetsp:Transcript_17570/g.37827  ORF Transcript_17570/g.37827 Transcript_17570/m.37827 type:complete len:244 (+) Transcript_17570:1121-1852(+)